MKNEMEQGVTKAEEEEKRRRKRRGGGRGKEEKKIEEHVNFCRLLFAV